MASEAVPGHRWTGTEIENENEDGTVTTKSLAIPTDAAATLVSLSNPDNDNAAAAASTEAVSADVAILDLPSQQEQDPPPVSVGKISQAPTNSVARDYPRQKDNQPVSMSNGANSIENKQESNPLEPRTTSVHHYVGGEIPTPTASVAQDPTSLQKLCSTIDSESTNRNEGGSGQNPTEFQKSMTNVNENPVVPAPTDSVVENPPCPQKQGSEPSSKSIDVNAEDNRQNTVIVESNASSEVPAPTNSVARDLSSSQTEDSMPNSNQAFMNGKNESESQGATASPSMLSKPAGNDMIKRDNPAAMKTGKRKGPKSNATDSSVKFARYLKKYAKLLVHRVDFFRENASDMAKLRTYPYTKVPSYYGQNEAGKDDKSALFEQRKRLARDTKHFPLLKGKGKLQFPMALLCETDSDDPLQPLLLAFVNYWRQLRSEKQHTLKKALFGYYLHANTSNERFQYVRDKKNAAESTSSPNDEKEKTEKEDSRAPASTTPWGFRSLETCSQLADSLGFYETRGDEAAGLKLACDWLRTANLEAPRVKCKRDDCMYPALARNSGSCCRHGFYFAPQKMYGSKFKRRGYLLLGDLYTRPYVTTKNCNVSKSEDTNGEQDNSNLLTTKRLEPCSCGNETCVGIGYSPTMVRVDVNKLTKDLQDEIWNNKDALDIESSKKKNSESVLRLAPWHFHPDYRVLLPDGSWRVVDFRSSSVFKDPITSKEWKGVPPPTYSPDDFVQEPAVKEYAARKRIIAETNDMLPSWCREYTKVEEGPYSIFEKQRDYLLERNAEMEKEMTFQAESFLTKQWAQEADTDRLQAKYDEKKFLKRKRPRPSASGLSGTNNKNGKDHASRKNRKKIDVVTVTPVDHTMMITNDGHADANPGFLDAGRHAQDRNDSRRMLPLHYGNTNANNTHQRHTMFPHSFEQHSLQHPHAHAQPNNNQLRHHPQYPHHQRQQQHPDNPYPHHATYPM
eukprot:jgi/Psemu1/23514/gm1.23514_g